MKNHRRPWVGITADVFAPDQRATRALREALVFSPRRYHRAIEAAGGTGVILPATGSRVILRQFAASLDGLLISGGNFDIHPRFYGEKAIKQLGTIKQDRTEFELELASLALQKDLPLLGICGGAQAINVALGGSLYQDIAAQLPQAMNHQQATKRNLAGHRVQVQPGSRLRDIVKRSTLTVNTTHHQAIKLLGKGLVVNAIADDGVIEGIESNRHSFALGVQWHPEVLCGRMSSQRRIFCAFIAACRRYDGRAVLSSARRVAWAGSSAGRF
jgi:putative glutamine amidotransferase